MLLTEKVHARPPPGPTAGSFLDAAAAPLPFDFLSRLLYLLSLSLAMVLGLLFMTGHASRLRCAAAPCNPPALPWHPALLRRRLSPRHDHGMQPCMHQGCARLLLHMRGNHNACLAAMAPASMPPPPPTPHPHPHTLTHTPQTPHTPPCRFDVSSWSLAFPLEALALGTLLYAAAIPGVLTNGAQESQPAPACTAATALGGGGHGCVQCGCRRMKHGGVCLTSQV